MKKNWYSKITSVTDNYNFKNLIYDKKKQLLDPLCTISTMIELLFKPIGTKFGINNHSITIDLPSENVYWYNLNNYQSYQRLWYSDSRENVSKLGIVIIRLIEWYIVPTYELLNNKCKINKKNLENSIQVNSSDISEIHELWNCLDELTNYFCLSLEKLIETYRDGNVIWSLQNYINLINDSKIGQYNKSKIPKIIIEDNENCIDFEKIKQLWSLKTLKEINELYKKCFFTLKEIKETKETKSILNDDTLEFKCKNTEKYNKKEFRKLKEEVIINESNEETFLSINKDLNNNKINNIVLLSTEQSDFDKEKKIEGYISAIRIFVDLVNNNFRDLIVKSTGNI